MAASEVSFRDLDFDYGFRVVSDRSGRTSYRWVAVGMPRITKHLEQCVFFLYGHDPQTGRLIGPGATGFFVSRYSQVLDNVLHIYAISNRHAVNNFSCIRINRGETESDLLDIDPAEWIWSDTDDLAAIDVTDAIGFDAEIYPWHNDISWVDESQFVTKAFSFYNNIGIGDQTVMIGLFADHAGGTRNVPVGRFGLLAATPDNSTPVRLGPNDCLARPAYLNDMRSRSGFSGSPVWVWRTPYDDMTGVSSLAGRASPAVIV